MIVTDVERADIKVLEKILWGETDTSDAFFLKNCQCVLEFNVQFHIIGI